ncbi:MAG: hypothetical protein VYB54_02995 [Pseudomonadota bacterium]|nr:hypothetical protein [Pseudomonadota bacterium]
MPVSAEIRDSIAWFTGSGLVEADEITTAFHGLYRQTAPRCCVFDFRKASFSALPAGQFRTLAANTLPYSDRRGPGARSVFCVSTAADMRFVRAFVANAATVSDTRFEVFFTIEECLDWLGADQTEIDTAAD